MRNLKLRVKQFQIGNFFIILLIISEKQIRSPKIGIIMVGNHPASESYVKKKINACNTVGIENELFSFGENTKQKEIEELIEYLNNRSDIDSILTQVKLLYFILLVTPSLAYE